MIYVSGTKSVACAIGLGIVLVGLSKVYFDAVRENKKVDAEILLKQTMATTSVPCKELTLVESTNPKATNYIADVSYEGPCGLKVLKGTYASSTVTDIKQKIRN